MCDTKSDIGVKVEEEVINLCEECLEVGLKFMKLFKIDLKLKE